MIVEFSVKNFRSIKELQTISFVATGLKSAEKYAEVDKNNIVEEGGMQLFKTLGIYGANASGKSNVVKAFSCFIKTITQEPSSQSNLSELCDPFLFQENAAETESFFQIVLIITGVKYRYGFTVKRNKPNKDGILGYSQEVVTNEWLYGQKQKNMRPLFKRSGQKVNSNLPDADKIPTSTPYEHSLFLTYAAAFQTREECCNEIRNFFKFFTIHNLNPLNHIDSDTSIYYVYHSDEKKAMIDLLSVFDLKYHDIYIEEDLPIETITKNDIFLTKRKHNQDVILNLRKNESEGTQKLFDLAGLLLRAFNSIPSSGFLILDEIDSNFHPALLIKLISLFNNPEINKANSQLLFTSHDTNLMSPAIARRDQFYFTEKNEDESTRLYSLADLRGIRNDADFARQYLGGYYGALPILEDYETTTTTNERTVELETK